MTLPGPNSTNLMRKINELNVTSYKGGIIDGVIEGIFNGIIEGKALGTLGGGDSSSNVDVAVSTLEGDSMVRGLSERNMTERNMTDRDIDERIRIAGKKRPISDSSALVEIKEIEEYCLKRTLTTSSSAHSDHP